MKSKIILVVSVLLLSTALTVLAASQSDAYLIRENAEALSDPAASYIDVCYRTVIHSINDPINIVVRLCGNPCSFYTVIHCTDKDQCVVS